MPDTNIIKFEFAQAAALKELLERQLQKKGVSQEEIEERIEQYLQKAGAECTLSDI